jgi:hypothetical protein
MKNIFNKRKEKPQSVEPAARITSDTIAEHREQVLSSGKKFKYPLQYSRSKLVMTASGIGVLAIIVFITIIWWQLYVAHAYNDFVYRVTKTVPIPVATVEGKAVRYSDYLMRYRSSIHFSERWEQVDFRTEDGVRQQLFLQEQSLREAIIATYAEYLADELGISVSDDELEEFLRLPRQLSGGEMSQQTHDLAVLDYYGWDQSEYRQIMKSQLLRNKVAYAIDDDAKSYVKQVVDQVSAGANFAGIAAKLQTDSAIYVPSSQVPLDDQDEEGILAIATKLAVGAVSDPIQSKIGNGYFIVRLNSKDDTSVRYEYIQIVLTKFSAQADGIVSDSSLVKKFIDVKSEDN